MMNMWFCKSGADANVPNLEPNAKSFDASMISRLDPDQMDTWLRLKIALSAKKISRLCLIWSRHFNQGEETFNPGNLISGWTYWPDWVNQNSPNQTFQQTLH